jgi:radical SAM superfamily enzyme YgiQ (UPF0313 family)
MLKRILERMHGRSPQHPAFTVALTFYSSDDNDISLPLASLAAYAEQVLPEVNLRIVPIFPLRDPGENSVEGYLERLTRPAPHLVGVSCMCPHWRPLDAYLRGIKAVLPETTVLIGGHQAILCPEETIQHPAVDFICVGDGEMPLAELIRNLREKRMEPVEGIWAAHPDGTIERTPPTLTRDLTTIPFPDYCLFEQGGTLRGLNLSNFARPDLFILPVMSGRGCPFHCTYCSNSTMLGLFGGKYLRKYDPEALVKELSRLRDRYDVHFFEFWDEQFIFDKNFVDRFLELYRLHVQRPFSIMARVEKMDENFCRTAAEAGCAVIWFGIECGNEAYRRHFLKRQMTNRQIMAAAENARRCGIQRVAFNMVGMPFETGDHLMETLRFNQSLEPEFFAFFTYLPLKGTALYEMAEEAGLLIADTASDYLNGYRHNAFRLNIREHPEGVSNEEFNRICQMMLAFAQKNNRFAL